MTKKKQRIAIAKACGTLENKGFKYDPNSVVTAYGCPPEEVLESPDYLNDLNAMQSAIKSLLKKDKSLFADKLMDSLGFDDDYYTRRVNLNDRVYSLNSYLIWEMLTQASPERLAKAFLKTLNLWEE